jgi:hypothetical protein
MHGTSKMGSMDPLEMVMGMWYKASFRAYSEFQNGMSFLQSLTKFYLFSIGFFVNRAQHCS